MKLLSIQISREEKRICFEYGFVALKSLGTLAHDCVTYRGFIWSSSGGVISPAAKRSIPAHAIMTALSVHSRGSGNTSRHCISSARVWYCVEQKCISMEVWVCKCEFAFCAQARVKTNTKENYLKGSPQIGVACHTARDNQRRLHHIASYIICPAQIAFCISSRQWRRDGRRREHISVAALFHCATCSRYQMHNCCALKGGGDVSGSVSFL